MLVPVVSNSRDSAIVLRAPVNCLQSIDPREKEPFVRRHSWMFGLLVETVDEYGGAQGK